MTKEAKAKSFFLQVTFVTATRTVTNMSLETGTAETAVTVSSDREAQKGSTLEHVAEDLLLRFPGVPTHTVKGEPSTLSTTKEVLTKRQDRVD